MGMAFPIEVKPKHVFRFEGLRKMKGNRAGRSCGTEFEHFGGEIFASDVLADMPCSSPEEEIVCGLERVSHVEWAERRAVKKIRAF